MILFKEKLDFDHSWMCTFAENYLPNLITRYNEHKPYKHKVEIYFMPTAGHISSTSSHESSWGSGTEIYSGEK